MIKKRGWDESRIKIGEKPAARRKIREGGSQSPQRQKTSDKQEMRTRSPEEKKQRRGVIGGITSGPMIEYTIVKRHASV